ncbi:hypothetical protein BV25DRAFT_765015 [Artomyces pyxidatus]|uniref:Uncharacterized protein n=1 Tax=Artomyces pyxidatus TaxID=48021 RepID=A0ACB8SYG5_9AGAM|nr:hypothetical protein BV25DRAFT_765015 [Artomyces pyxidatus]
MHASTVNTAPTARGCFSPDPADRLISITLSVARELTPGQRFIIDIPARTLTRYIDAHPAAAGTGPVAVPWDIWGPRGARVTAVPEGDTDWSVSGARRATVHRGPDAEILTVLDYSPRRVARAVARGVAAVLHGAEVGAEHTGGHGVLRTQLPCISTEIALPESVAIKGVWVLRAWICENGVMLAKVCRCSDGC